MGRFGHILAVLLGIALVMPVVSWSAGGRGGDGRPSDCVGRPRPVGCLELFHPDPTRTPQRAGR